VRPSAALALAACLLGAGAGAAPNGPALRIEEPAAGRPVSGVLTLRARVEPEGLPVARVSFAADGSPVCLRDAPPWECPWDAGEGTAAHTIRAVAVLRDGTRLVDSVQTEAAPFSLSVDVRVVQVTATVTDGEGRLVKGLRQEDFRVFEDGQPEEVTHFIGSESERELVVAVDMSASMAPAMGRCGEAVKRFLDTVRPVDRVTVLAFNDNVFTLARREATPEARLRAVGRLRAWGSTSFYDAVLKGLDLLEKHRGRRALVLFTDGEDMVSHATAEDVQRRVEVSATPVFVVAQGKGMREPALKRVLDRIAGVSGGRAFYTDRIEQLEGAFAAIGEDIASQYLLAYSPADAARDGSWRTIRVEVAGKRRTVRARQGYRAVGSGG
jgi:Ca-activated chloride channel family protein